MKQTELFASTKKENKTAPLANRMAPRTLDEFAGQEKILGQGKLLRRTVESDRLGSVIFYGPPGTGKSALAKIIALTTKSHFEETNAVMAGVADIRKIIEQAKMRLAANSQKTTLLIDEIHHFNRSQQDALLPDVEKGNITLIGITTENPYFYVNKALLSRSVLFEFEKLTESHLKKILELALADAERGLGKYKVDISPDARKHLIKTCEGDARRLLNALEIGVLTTRPDQRGCVNFDVKVAEESLQKKFILYDKSSDEHYDHASAFIKSMRGSDPDAALYWMSKMLAAGEDPRFVARRIVICASEDVGNADPNALVLACAALDAVEFVGMPEARIPLAQAAVYIATAPKSNASYAALRKAEKEVAQGKTRPVPDHLKDPNMDSEARGHGKGYKYPHDYPANFVEQEYMPDKAVFYDPGGQGYEAEIRKRIENWRKKSADAQGRKNQKG
ncbi:MAG: replication-associated recombination protein A [Endomicrobiales bacterium]|nr:replication-associated recombination protein A [Endomicrobiales bacterium]